MKNIELYPGCKAMLFCDAKRMDRLNASNGWGLSNEELEKLIRQHQEARRIMETIEYRLTDINFHHECSLLSSGKYAEALREVSDNV